MLHKQPFEDDLPYPYTLECECSHCGCVWRYDAESDEWVSTSDYGSEIRESYDPLGNDCCMACAEECYEPNDLIEFAWACDSIANVLKREELMVGDSLIAQAVLTMQGFEEPETIDHPMETSYFTRAWDEYKRDDPHGLADNIGNVLDWHDEIHDGKIGWKEFYFWYCKGR